MFFKLNANLMQQKHIGKFSQTNWYCIQFAKHPSNIQKETINVFILKQCNIYDYVYTCSIFHLVNHKWFHHLLLPLDVSSFAWYLLHILHKTNKLLTHLPWVHYNEKFTFACSWKISWKALLGLHITTVVPWWLWYKLNYFQLY
jgi:hypothetical protein